MRFNNQFHIWDQTPVFRGARPAAPPPCNVAPGCSAFLQGRDSSSARTASSTKAISASGCRRLERAILWQALPRQYRRPLCRDQPEFDRLQLRSAARSIVTTKLSRTYHDFLPSMNAVLEPADNFLIRFGAAYVMARPDLINLLPGGATATVTGSNFNVTENNPNLNPFRAKTADCRSNGIITKGRAVLGRLLLQAPGFPDPDRAPVHPLQPEYRRRAVSLVQPACGASYVAPPPAAATRRRPGCSPSRSIPRARRSMARKSPGSSRSISARAAFANTGFTGNITFVQATQTYFNTDGSVLTKADLTGLSHTVPGAARSIMTIHSSCCAPRRPIAASIFPMAASIRATSTTS
jgi:hypothetical protein